MKGNSTAGHLSVLLTIIIWGTTFISTKILMADLQPVEILFFRFVVAMAGIALISFNGSKLALNPTGDLLALLAALVWACYSVLTKNKRLRLPHHPHHPEGVLLRHAPNTEKITALAAVGTFLTLAGLLLSESNLFLRKEEKQNGLAK